VPCGQSYGSLRPYSRLSRPIDCRIQKGNKALSLEHTRVAQFSAQLAGSTSHVLEASCVQWGFAQTDMKPQVGEWLGVYVDRYLYIRMDD
jgi:hypothetical protein